MDFSIVISIISTVVAIIALINSAYIQQKLLKRQLTIEAFNVLQREVLDKLVFDPKGNASIIVENLDNPKCNDAYKDYKLLVSRLDHFAVGVNKHIYDFKVVNDLAGSHLVFVYEKIKPIIEQANRYSHEDRYYGNFEKLIIQLQAKKGTKK